MGESACLVRSFSSPADTSCAAQVQEGNPIGVLGESISFGRFMSESLAWEKWSIFSHNRYVEEAEKFSRPGSVAEKKAYFEAHYKRKTAEKAAALIQEVNASANGTFDSETQEGNCTDSSIEMESKADSNVNANEPPDKDAANYQVVDYVYTNKYEYDIVQNDLDISNMKGAEDVPHPFVDTNLGVASSVLLDNSNQFDNVEVHENITSPIKERMPLGTAGEEVLALPVNIREVHSSPKLSTKTRAAKLACYPGGRKAAAAVQPRNGINSSSKGKKSVGDSTEKRLTVQDSVEKKRLTAQSLQMSINLPSRLGETSKTTAQDSVYSRNGINSSSKGKKSVGGSIEKRLTVQDSVEKKRLTAQSLHMSINLPSRAGETSKTTALTVQPRNGINSASKSMKCVGDSVQRRPTARSLHMSVNLTSRTGETSKTVSMSQQNRIKKICSIQPNISEDHPVASQTSTMASNGVLNQASANPQSQGRRTQRLLNKSVSGGVSANAKLSSTSVECLKSSSTPKSNPPSLTISSPFRFRSEERAVKRKEFLDRMDEIKSKEAYKVQLQRRLKEKTEHDHKKLQQSSGSEPKLNEDRNDGSQSPINQIRKSSVTRPGTPKLGRKAGSSTVQEKNFGNSWKPPISTNNNKRVTEKNNRTTRQPVTSPSNTTRENASPNIQH